VTSSGSEPTKYQYEDGIKEGGTSKTVTGMGEMTNTNNGTLKGREKS
jgi:hypothetical protein